MTDQSLFVDVYSTVNGLKQRVPREWLDDPILGRDIRKTPSQRELDGELPDRPAGDASAKEIGEFAEAADLDLSGSKTNADKLVAIEQALGAGGDVQAGVVAVDPAPVAPDPLAPELVAHGDAPSPVDQGADLSTDGGDASAEDYAGEAWTFQALKDEVDARNAGREDDDRISKGGSADDLRQRLVEDDGAQADPDADEDLDGVEPVTDEPVVPDSDGGAQS